MFVLASVAERRPELAQSAARAVDDERLATKPKLAAHRRILMEEYFDFLLWKGREIEAQSFAEKSALSEGNQSAVKAFWLTMAGDAMLLQNSVPPKQAIGVYEQALALDPTSSLILGRLSDVYFKLGDRTHEREYREKLYGVLRE